MTPKQINTIIARTIRFIENNTERSSIRLGSAIIEELKLMKYYNTLKNDN